MLLSHLTFEIKKPVEIRLFKKYSVIIALIVVNRSLTACSVIIALIVVNRSLTACSVIIALIVASIILGNLIIKLFLFIFYLSGLIYYITSSAVYSRVTQTTLIVVNRSLTACSVIIALIVVNRSLTACSHS